MAAARLAAALHFDPWCGAVIGLSLVRILVWLLGQDEDCGKDQPELHHDSTLQGEGEKCVCAAGVAAKIKCSK